MMKSDGVIELDRVWIGLEQHFCHHATLVERFRQADRSSVAGMWRSARNELGQPLSPFEREALIERYCELFGVWPEPLS